MRKIHYVIASIFALAFGISVSSSHPVQGTAGYTSAPGDSFCSQCHSPSSSLNGNIAITGLPSQIMAGETYSLTITLTTTLGTGVKGGFQLLVLNNNNQNTGTFSNNSVGTSIKLVSGGRTYLGHEPAANFSGGNTITWEVDWTAPSSNTTSQAKFYIAGMIGNGNNTSSGDRPVSFNVFVPYQSNNPDPINLTISNIINPSCSDTQDGSATVNITGGTPPYNILWNNGETTPTAIGLPGGLAVVTVTDAAAASSSRSTTLVSPTPVTLSVTTTDESCFGANDGTAFASAGGGTGSKTYSWSNGGQGSFQSNLAGGNYSVTATDFNGCQKVESFTIESPGQILINIVNIQNPFCFGQQSGSIEVEAEGGAGGYIYNWSNGANGPSADNLAAGMYRVTVTDNNNCTSTASYNLTQPAPVSVGFPSVNHVTCFGANNGSVTAQAAGGNGNFTYAWSNGSNGASIQNLGPGTYTVTAVDIEGCVGTNSVNINQPLPITITLVSSQPASCSGASDGAIVVEASGSNTNFQFAWSNGATTASNVNIPAGTYTVTVTDPSQCTQTASFTVGTNAPFTLSLTESENVSCFGLSDGFIEVSVSPPGNYTYTWSNGSSGPSLSDLPAGTYICTASDGSGCESSPLVVVITQPSAIEAVFSILKSIDCFGDNDGQISVSVSGGAGNYSYAWSDDSATDTITALMAGNYVLTVTDGDNCQSVEAVFLTSPDSLGIQLLTNDELLCYGDEDGRLVISVFGGTGPKTIEWSTGDSGVFIENIGAGTYSVTIEDTKGCTVSDSFFVEQPAQMLISAVVTPVSPDSGDDGAITITVSGGTGNVSLLWSTGETTHTIDSLTIGEYSVTVTDENGCMAVESYLVSVVDCGMAVDISTSDVTCFSGDDGGLQIEVTGAFGQYTTTLWLENQVINPPYDNLTGGTYRLSVVDTAFCSIVIENIIIKEPLPIVVESMINHPTTGQSNGSIDANASGGTGAITYVWYNSANMRIGEGQRIENLRQGLYFLIVTDSLNCSRMYNFVLQDKVSTDDIWQYISMKIFPNPANGLFNIQLNEPVYCTGITLRNTVGQVLEKITVEHVIDQYQVETFGIPSGLVIVEVRFGDKIAFSKVNIQP